VLAWGLNEYGQTNVPTGLKNVVAIAAGGWHNLALKSDGTLVAWGAGGPNTNALVVYGQNTVPEGLSNVFQIAAGSVHSLAVVGTGSPLQPLAIFAPARMKGKFHVEVPTANGKVYRLEYKSQLTDPTWTAVMLAAGNGRLAQLSDANTTQAARFYRVSSW
jgi:hypothetical protein